MIQTLYHTSLEGECFGPFSYETICNMHLTPDILVMSSASQQWDEAHQYPELADSLDWTDYSKRSHQSRSESVASIPQRPRYSAEYREGDVRNLAKYRKKVKKAKWGIFTLGLSGAYNYGFGKIWKDNIFNGMSFMSNSGIAFVFKMLSFTLLTALIAIPYFLYSIYAYFTYSYMTKKIEDRIKFDK